MIRAYEKDYAGWAEDTAKAIEDGRFSEIDQATLADEVRDLGKSERRELESAMRVLLLYLLKQRYQPSKQTRSWELTVKVQRLHIARFLRESPSLREKLDEIVADAYQTARLEAANETGLESSMFPGTCELTIPEILD